MCALARSSQRTAQTLSSRRPGTAASAGSARTRGPSCACRGRAASLPSTTLRRCQGTPFLVARMVSSWRFLWALALLTGCAPSVVVQRTGPRVSSAPVVVGAPCVRRSAPLARTTLRRSGSGLESQRRGEEALLHGRAKGCLLRVSRATLRRRPWRSLPSWLRVSATQRRSASWRLYCRRSLLRRSSPRQGSGAEGGERVWPAGEEA